MRVAKPNMESMPCQKEQPSCKTHMLFIILINNIIIYHTDTKAYADAFGKASIDLATLTKMRDQDGTNAIGLPPEHPLARAAAAAKRDSLRKPSPPLGLRKSGGGSLLVVVPTGGALKSPRGSQLHHNNIDHSKNNRQRPSDSTTTLEQQSPPPPPPRVMKRQWSSLEEQRFSITRSLREDGIKKVKAYIWFQNRIALPLWQFLNEKFVPTRMTKTRCRRVSQLSMRSLSQHSLGQSSMAKKSDHSSGTEEYRNLGILSGQSYYYALHLFKNLFLLSSAIGIIGRCFHLLLVGLECFRIQTFFNAPRSESSSDFWFPWGPHLSVYPLRELLFFSFLVLPTLALILKTRVHSWNGKALDSGAFNLSLHSLGTLTEIPLGGSLKLLFCSAVYLGLCGGPLGAQEPFLVVAVAVAGKVCAKSEKSKKLLLSQSQQGNSNTAGGQQQTKSELPLFTASAIVGGISVMFRNPVLGMVFGLEHFEEGYSLGLANICFLFTASCATLSATLLEVIIQTILRKVVVDLDDTAAAQCCQPFLSSNGAIIRDLKAAFSLGRLFQVDLGLDLSDLGADRFLFLALLPFLVTLSCFFVQKTVLRLRDRLSNFDQDYWKLVFTGSAGLYLCLGLGLFALIAVLMGNENDGNGSLFYFDKFSPDLHENNKFEQRNNSVFTKTKTSLSTHNNITIHFHPGVSGIESVSSNEALALWNRGEALLQELAQNDWFVLHSPFLAFLIVIVGRFLTFVVSAVFFEEFGGITFVPGIVLGGGLAILLCRGFAHLTVNNNIFFLNSQEDESLRFSLSEQELAATTLMTSGVGGGYPLTTEEQNNLANISISPGIIGPGGGFLNLTNSINTELNSALINPMDTSLMFRTPSLHIRDLTFLRLGMLMGMASFVTSLSRMPFFSVLLVVCNYRHMILRNSDSHPVFFDTGVLKQKQYNSLDPGSLIFQRDIQMRAQVQLSLNNSGVEANNNVFNITASYPRSTQLAFFDPERHLPHQTVKKLLMSRKSNMNEIMKSSALSHDAYLFSQEWIYFLLVFSSTIAYIFSYLGDEESLTERISEQEGADLLLLQPTLNNSSPRSRVQSFAQLSEKTNPFQTRDRGDSITSHKSFQSNTNSQTTDRPQVVEAALKILTQRRISRSAVTGSENEEVHNLVVNVHKPIHTTKQALSKSKFSSLSGGSKKKSNINSLSTARRHTHHYNQPARDELDQFDDVIDKMAELADQNARLEAGAPINLIQDTIKESDQESNESFFGKEEEEVVSAAVILPGQTTQTDLDEDIDTNTTNRLEDDALRMGENVDDKKQKNLQQKSSSKASYILPFNNTTTGPMTTNLSTTGPTTKNKIQQFRSLSKDVSNYSTISSNTSKVHLLKMERERRHTTLGLAPAEEDLEVIKEGPCDDVEEGEEGNNINSKPWVSVFEIKSLILNYILENAPEDVTKFGHIVHLIGKMEVAQLQSLREILSRPLQDLLVTHMVDDQWDNYPPADELSYLQQGEYISQGQKKRSLLDVNFVNPGKPDLNDADVSSGTNVLTGLFFAFFFFYVFQVETGIFSLFMLDTLLLVL